MKCIQNDTGLEGGLNLAEEPFHHYQPTQRGGDTVIRGVDGGKRVKTM